MERIEISARLEKSYDITRSVKGDMPTNTVEFVGRCDALGIKFANRLMYSEKEVAAQTQQAYNRLKAEIFSKLDKDKFYKVVIQTPEYTDTIPVPHVPVSEQEQTDNAGPEGDDSADS